MGTPLQCDSIIGKGRTAVLTVSAPAKINLVLEILGKRQDGYHEIRSIMHTIDLCDTLTFILHHEITMECNEPSLYTSDNLVLRAARLLREKAGYKDGVLITLTKCIPLSSGLGGGSSDAAATLLALNTLWRLELTTGELATIAAELGSDVPYFIYKGLALIKGRGETVIPLPAPSPMWFTLVFPALEPIPSKTKHLYSRVTPEFFSKTAKNTEKLMEHWSTSGQIDTRYMYNVFDAIARDAFPGIGDNMDQMLQCGAQQVHLAGSGPTLVAPARNLEHAMEMERNLAARSVTARAVSTLLC